MRWLRFAAFGALVPLALFALLASSIAPREMDSAFHAVESTAVSIPDRIDRASWPVHVSGLICCCWPWHDRRLLPLEWPSLTSAAIAAPDLPFSSSAFVPAAHRSFLQGVDSPPQLGSNPRAAPEWPDRAARLGIPDGWVLIEFDVSEAGAVENARVIEATPSGVFEAYALRAIQRWRYRPAIEDGRAVARAGLRVRIRFETEGAES